MFTHMNAVGQVQQEWKSPWLSNRYCLWGRVTATANIKKCAWRKCFRRRKQQSLQCLKQSTVIGRINVIYVECSQVYFLALALFGILMTHHKLGCSEWTGRIHSGKGVGFVSKLERTIIKWGVCPRRIISVKRHKRVFPDQSSDRRPDLNYIT